MKELTHEQRQEYWAKYVRFRWEITRRNKDYQCEYEDFKKTIDEAIKHTKRMKIARKWGFAVDPLNDDPYLVEMGSGIPGNIKIIKSPFVDYLIDEGLMTLIGEGSGQNLIDNEVIISIDINGPDWLTIISIENLLKSIRQLLSQNITQKRIAWDMLDIYLKVFDMNGIGKSIDYIAKEIYPNEYKKADIEGTMPSLIRKVQRNLKTAKKIIHSGQIT